MPNRLVEGFVSIFGSKSISVLVGFILTPLLARILGSSLYGDYAFLMSVFGIGIIFVNAGTFDGLRKYVSPRKSRGWNSEILAFYLTINGGISIALGLVITGLFITGWLRQWYGALFETYFLLLAGLIVSRQFFSITRGTLMGFRAERYSELLYILRRVLFAIGGVGLAYIGLNVTGVLLGDIIATVAITVIGFSFVLQRVDLPRSFSLTNEGVSAAELLGFNSLNVVLILLTASLYHTDVVLLRVLEGSQPTGFYKAALTVAEFLWFVPMVLQIALLQETSGLWERDEVEAISALSSRISRYNYLFTQLIAIGIAILAEPFVGLYFGGEFLQAASVVPILLIGALAFAVSRPIFAIGQSKGALRTLIAATGLAAGVNLVLNLLLIPPFGINGAAVATAIGYGLMVVFHTAAAKRIGFNPVRDLRLFRGLSVGAGTGASLLLVSVWLEDPLIKLAVIPPLGLGLYTALALGLGAIQISELADLREFLPV